MDTAVLENLHYQAADQRAENRSLAAAQAPTADDDGGNDVKLETTGCGRVAHCSERRELQDTRQARRQTANRVHGHFDERDIDPTEPRCRLVGTDGIDIATEQTIRFVDTLKALYARFF
jgi:hypothetical protein